MILPLIVSINLVYKVNGKKSKNVPGKSKKKQNQSFMILKNFQFLLICRFSMSVNTENFIICPVQKKFYNLCLTYRGIILLIIFINLSVLLLITENPAPVFLLLSNFSKSISLLLPLVFRTKYKIVILFPCE